MAPVKDEAGASKPKKTYDDEESEDERPAKRGKKGGKRGIQKAPRNAPPFKPLPSHAHSLSEQQVDLVFTKCMRGYPRKFKLKLLNLLCDDPSKAQNPIYGRHTSELEDLRKSILKKVPENPDRDLPTINTAVLAHRLGRVELVDLKDDDVYPDDTFEEDFTGPVSAASRRREGLRAYTSQHKLLDDQGTVKCWCGLPAAIRTKKGWGENPTTSFYVCKEGECRLNIGISALIALQDMMYEMGVETVPVWFCPVHPDRDIKISEVKLRGEGSEAVHVLTASCTFYENDGGEKKFCVSERIGLDGKEHAATGAPYWKCIEALSPSAKKT